MSIFTKRFLLIASFLLFLGLALISLITVNIDSNDSYSTYDSNTHNLLAYLPLTFWISIFGFGGILVTLFILPLEENPKFTYLIMFLCVLIILELFFGTVYLVEPNPRLSDSFLHGNIAQIITNNGHLTGQFNYEGYPLPFIFLSVLTQITGIDLTSWLQILPAIFVILFFTFLAYSILSLTGRPIVSIVATLVYGLATYYLPFHFSPQLCCWLLFFTLIMLMTKNVSPEKQVCILSPRSTTVLIFFVLLAIGLSHPASQFYVFLSLLFIILVNKKIWLKSKMTFTVLLFVLVLYSSWAIFFASDYLLYVLTSFKNAFGLVLSDFSNSIINRPFIGPVDVTYYEFYRRSLYVFVGVTGFFGLIKMSQKRKSLAIFLIAIILASLTMFPLTLVGYLPLERSIKLAFISLSVFSAYLLVNKHKVSKQINKCFLKVVSAFILILLIITLPLNFSSNFWNESSSMVHDWEISSSKFISNNFHDGFVLSQSKDISIMSYYGGNFTGVYRDTYVVGSPPDYYNATYITYKNRIQLVYITELTLLDQSFNGRNITMTFLSDYGFNCISSDSHSMVFINPQTTTSEYVYAK